MRFSSWGRVKRVGEIQCTDCEVSVGECGALNMAQNFTVEIERFASNAIWTTCFILVTWLKVYPSTQLLREFHHVYVLETPTSNVDILVKNH